MSAYLAQRAVMFRDASAIVPLLLEEPWRERMLSILECDAVMLVWRIVDAS